MKYVYILGYYEEHGLEYVKATLDRARLPDLVRSYAGLDAGSWRISAELADQEGRNVEALLARRSDEELSAEEQGVKPDEGAGWGGLKLYVVPLR